LLRSNRAPGGVTLDLLPYCFARYAAATCARRDELDSCCSLAAIAKLYVIAASHPCATVEEGLRLKELPYRQVELLAGYHHVHQRLRFGARSVPGIRFADGEKVLGSRAILHRLEERIPEPALLPSDPNRRQAVEEAEHWGEQVLQDAVRRIEIMALIRNPEALLSQAEASTLPTPKPLVRLVGPLGVRAEARVHGASEESVRADLAALPNFLDRIDRLLADGLIGGEPPNVADLQIGSSVRVLSNFGDLAPLLSGRPAEALAERLFPDFPGHFSNGSLPSAWIPTAG
jgi:glutathione S-transferase